MSYEPGVSLAQAHRGSLRHRATTPRILKPDSAVAGVNGDFYALSGVPRGLAVDRQRGLLHGRVSGWNSAFYLDRAGRPRIDTLPIKLSIRQRPELTITGLNSPYAEPGGIVAYTPDWGRTAGRLVTQGQRHRVRAVVVRHGRVRSSSAKLPSGTKVRGLLLIGRDAGARQLRRLRIGDKVSLRSRVPGRPRMAISGNGFLVRGGEIAIHNDQVLNPRTGVGIDEDTGEVLLVMVEGRVDHSRGYTTIEFAQLMIDLGAEAAVNFDGGGSATMVATRANGSTGVVNVPPSYELREVSNALEVLYQAP